MFDQNVTCVFFALAVACVSLLLQGCGFNAADEPQLSKNTVDGQLATQREHTKLVADRRDTSQHWQQAKCINSKFECFGTAKWCATARATCSTYTFLAFNYEEGRAPTSCLKVLNDKMTFHRSLCVPRKNETAVNTVLCKAAQDDTLQVFECNGPAPWCYEKCLHARTGTCFFQCNANDAGRPNLFIAMGDNLQCEERLMFCMPFWTSRDTAATVDLDQRSSLRDRIAARQGVV
eukprot:TRINITY_DN4886_c0_g1_i1.p1 TRINITY_DN4886_c0_g1~~TRINITY_DN4886_c0_g1_i1.p1  ORF type:complete len:234 (+),score=12.13 TRINITY_DN4886_c0_g1_i1:164-865(+)